MLTYLMCSTCKTNIPDHARHYTSWIDKGDEFAEPKYHVYISTLQCLICSRPMVGVRVTMENAFTAEEDLFNKQVYPVAILDVPKTSSQVPSHLYRDFSEAHQIVTISPRASAVLIRRMLHTLLVEKCGGKGVNFKADIKIAESHGFLFGKLIHLIKAVQECGNYSSHANWSKDTLTLIETSVDEARLLLTIAHDFLIHFYETQPEQDRTLDRIRQLAENKLKTKPTEGGST